MFSISEGRPQDPESCGDLLDAAMKFELLSIPFRTHVKISSGPNRQALKGWHLKNKVFLCTLKVEKLFPNF